MARYRKGGFSHPKYQRRYKNVADALKRRWREHRGPEHSYASGQSESTEQIEYPAVDHEEEVKENARATNEWREGRRIVELGVLADALKACTKCGLPLQLAHAKNIQTFGLSAILKVPCSNTSCCNVNTIPTGKRHGRVWDANAKLASATLNAGLGERQVNTLLSGLNIPTVSHVMLAERQKGVGEAMQDVAKETMEEALAVEKELTFQKTGSESLSVSVDAGWQKRGSGRSYDSLSGHCSMIGTESGKIVNCAVRVKACKICTLAANSNKPPKDHDCHINWQGSAKGMESDMVVSMVKDLHHDGNQIDYITGDEDTTTIARVRANVDENIKKTSDANHIKKLFGNSLYELKKTHKSLTVKVITYLQSCFNNIIAQGKGNQEKIKSSLLALSEHPFGQHQNCDKSWCRFIDNPTQQYNSLPHGKPLTDLSLKTALFDVLASYSENCDKLASLGSTQANESFNRLVASKAPKQQHYSSSGSFSYRVAACVAQKNRGHKFVVDVNKQLHLSPGFYTSRTANLRDLQHRKRKAIATTYKAKKRRRYLKSKRQQKLSTNEVREGVTYSSGVTFEPSDDIQKIPDIQQQPSYETILPSDEDFVFFDIEATGLARDSHILQLAAKRGENVFSSYILPEKAISKKSTEVTGIKMEGRKMFCNNKEVHPVGIRDGLEKFYQFLVKYDKNVITGHNIRCYDVPVLLNAFERTGMIDRFSRAIFGYLDTLPLFRTVYPGLKSYSQGNLYKEIFNETFPAHDAMEDIVALSRLFSHAKPDTEARKSCAFSYDSAVQMFEQAKKTKCLLSSLSPLSSVITNRTAKSIAASGLAFCHLKLAFDRDGRQGIEDVLKEEDAYGKARVTKSRKIVDAISDFFSKQKNFKM